MDRFDAIPGLLRGPANWVSGECAISTFSSTLCRDVLLNKDRVDLGSRERARAGIDALTAARVGGDCWSAPAKTAPGGILIVAPSAVTDAWTRLVAAVASERGDDSVTLLVPDTRSKLAYAGFAADHDMALITGPANAWSLLDSVSALYTIDDELGFIALLRGIRVRCFGQPFYAGWGLTEDDELGTRQIATRSLEDVFAAACLLATSYLDPYGKQPSTFESTQAILADWRRVNDANRGIAACMGMSFWKQKRISDLLRSSDGSPEFAASTADAVEVAKKHGGKIAVWAAREPADLAATAAEAGISIVRIEDGFVRSVGLGADFMPAASIVLDEAGIYFDPAKPSDLENILASANFSAALVERSRRLIQTLVARGITKYNTGTAMPQVDTPPGRRTLFVPGQVEDDRSVATGGAGIYRNIDLLRRVRALNPDAFIIYKPHPDVDAGHRLGAIPDDEALSLADRIIRGVSTAAVIPAVDEIHTLTSLTGFEALIRRRKVVVYGQPFYAGWGLTADMAPMARRTRKLSLEELIAGTLVLYARYFDPATRLPCGPEILIERLSHPELWRPGVLVVLRRLQGEVMRRLGNFRTTKTSHVSTAHLDKRQKHVKPA